jgi:hypothetical protein
LSKPKPIPSDFKACSKCGVEKPLQDFHKQLQGKLGRASWCKRCVADLHSKYRKEQPDKLRTQNKKYRDKHKEKINAKRYTDNLRSYGISLEEYEKLVLSQHGVCAICKQPETSSRKSRLSVDHDHTSGRARGLLCQRCNAGIGLFNDSKELLMAAMEYIDYED